MKKRRIITILIAALFVAIFLAACVVQDQPIVAQSVDIVFYDAYDGRIVTQWQPGEKDIVVETPNHPGASPVLSFMQEGSNQWQDEQPTTVGNHQVKAYVNSVAYKGEKAIPFIITRNTELSIYAPDVTHTTATISTFDPLSEGFLDTTAITDRTGLSVEVIYTRDGREYTHSQLTAGVFNMEFTVSTDTHLSTTTATLTIEPDQMGADADIEWGGWFGGTGTFEYNGTPRALTVSLPNRPYFTGNYTVFYNQSDFAPSIVGTYAVVIEIEVANAPILRIEVGDIIIVPRRVTPLAAVTKNFNYNQPIAFSDDISNYITFDDNTALPRVSDFIIEFERQIDQDTFAAPTTTIPTLPGVYRTTFILRGTVTNFAAMPSVYTIYTIGVRPLENDAVFYNLDTQVYGSITPIDFNREIVSAHHDFYSLRFTGTANDGTNINSETQPTQAGEYTVTLTVTTHGVIQQFSADFTVRRQIVRFTAQNRTIFADNVPVNLGRVLNENGQPVAIDDLSITFNLLGSGYVAGIYEPGTYTLAIGLSAQKGNNFELSSPITATYTVPVRHAPVLEQSYAVYSSMPQGSSAYLQNDGIAIHHLFSFFYLYADGTPVGGLPRNAGEYIVRVEVLYIDLVLREFYLPFIITERPAQLEVSNLEFEENVDFSGGETLDFGLQFTDTINPGITSVQTAYRVFGTTGLFTDGTPSEPGAFEVRFTVTVPNFMPIVISRTVTIFAEGAVRVRWNAALQQTYGLTTPLQMLEEYGQEFVSISFYGTANNGTIKNEANSLSYINNGATTPTQAGSYLITLVLRTPILQDNGDGVLLPTGDYEYLETNSPFFIARRDVDLQAQNKVFEIGDSVTHSVSAEGFTIADMPAYSVAFSQNLLDATTGLPNYTPVSGTISTNTEAVFLATFTLDDNYNFNQTAPTFARYVVTNDLPLTQTIGLRYDYTYFYNIAAPTAPTPVGTEQPVEITGLNNFERILSIYYRRTHRFLGAQHGDGTAAFTAGGTTPVPVTEPATTEAPSQAGVYEVVVSVYNALSGEIRTANLTYTIRRRVVNVTHLATAPLSVTASAAAIRTSANTAVGNSSANAVQLFFEIDEPWLNYSSGYAASRRRAAISMLTIDAVELADGSQNSFSTITVRSTRPIANADLTNAGANNFYAVTSLLAQLPANARAGLYRITYYIDQPNFVGISTAYLTVEARAGELAQPLEWTNLTQIIGTSQQVVPVPRIHQSHNASIYFTGIDGTDFARSTTKPTLVGRYLVSTVGVSDGVEQEWTAILVIQPHSIRLVPNNRNIPFHQLNGNAIPITLADLGVPMVYRTEIAVTDFDILFYRYVAGAPSAIGTTTVPTHPGRYRVTIQLNSNRNPNFSSDLFEARWEITARTGQIGMPPARVSLGAAQAPMPFPVIFQPFHLNTSITYEGIGTTVFAPSQNPPTALGLYRVTVVAYADTVREEVTGEMHIRNTIATGLAATLTFCQQGSRLPIFPTVPGADANNFIEYRFVNRIAQSDFTVRLDGRPLPTSLPFRPGPYTFTVTAHGGMEATQTQGTITVIFATGAQGIQDAVFYANYHYNNIATDVMTTFFGWSSATSVGTTINTFAQTTRVRSTHPNSTVQSYFRTTANGNAVPLGIADVRGAMESIVPNNNVDRVYFRERRGNQVDRNTQRNRIIRIGWGNNFTGNTRHYFVNQAQAGGVGRVGYGIWVHNFSGYNFDNINPTFSRTITTPINFGQFTSGIGRNTADGTYWVRFGLTHPGQGIINHILAMSNGERWQNNNENYHAFYMRLDRYGRVTWMRTFDSYRVTAQARLDGQEWITYSDLDEYGNSLHTFYGIPTYMTHTNFTNGNVMLTGYLMQQNFNGNSSNNISYRGADIHANARRTNFNLSVAQDH